MMVNDNGGYTNDNGYINVSMVNVSNMLVINHNVN